LVLIFTSIFSVAFANPEIQINIPEYVLTLIDKGQVVKNYDIAVGTPYEQTPTGSFAIFYKLENPTWYPGAKFTDQTPVPPGKSNPLGTRWMEFAPTFGIHGTNKDWDISTAVSGGCIRMHDVDARELFEIADYGTPVTIVYQTLKLTEKADGLYLKVMPDIYRRQTNTPEVFAELFKPYFESGYHLIKTIDLSQQDFEEAYELKVATRTTSAKQNSKQVSTDVKSSQSH
jgi:L,D-transpeptidase ErfK/SrfK